jgi:hypothetical protein
VEYIVCSSSRHFANQISSPLFSKLSHDTQFVASWEVFPKEMLVILAGDVLREEGSQNKRRPKAMPLEGFIFACPWNKAPFR